MSRPGDERRQRLRRVGLDVLADARAAVAERAVLNVFADSTRAVLGGEELVASR